jgi:threonyl-tRNA synthetase
MEILITLPDGAVRSYPVGTTPLQIAASISEGLARNVLAAKVDGQVQDATRPLSTSCALQLLTFNDADGKATFWHSSAHLMAEALEALYPGVKLAIGPAIENGFYYDVDFGEKSLSPEEFGAIEAKMLELAKTNSAYMRKEVSKADKTRSKKKEIIKDTLTSVTWLAPTCLAYFSAPSFAGPLTKKGALSSSA